MSSANLSWTDGGQVAVNASSNSGPAICIHGPVGASVLWLAYLGPALDSGSSNVYYQTADPNQNPLQWTKPQILQTSKDTSGQPPTFVQGSSLKLNTVYFDESEPETLILTTTSIATAAGICTTMFYLDDTSGIWTQYNPDLIAPPPGLLPGPYISMDVVVASEGSPFSSKQSLFSPVICRLDFTANITFLDNGFAYTVMDGEGVVHTRFGNIQDTGRKYNKLCMLNPSQGSQLLLGYTGMNFNRAWELFTFDTSDDTFKYTSSWEGNSVAPGAHLVSDAQYTEQKNEEAGGIPAAYVLFQTMNPLEGMTIQCSTTTNRYNTTQVWTPATTVLPGKAVIDQLPSIAGLGWKAFCAWTVHGGATSTIHIAYGTWTNPS